MEVSDAIKSRRSIRAFKGRQIEEDKLTRVLEAGRLAPSARNMQEWKFIVAREKSLRSKLMQAARNQTFVSQAPAVIVACGMLTDVTMGCGQLSYPIDVAISLEHMALQAVAEGLGTCWVCAFSEQDVKSLLGIPDPIRVVALMPIGYPDESPEPRPRKPLDQIVCFDRYE